MSKKSLINNWNITINKYKEIIDNDLLFNNVFNNLKILDQVNNQIYISTNDEYAKIYLTENKAKLEQLYNSINQQTVNLVFVDDNEWIILKDKIYHEKNNVNCDLYLNKSYNYSNYIVSAFNLNAYKLMKNILEFNQSNFNPIFIYGNTGLGKTHLVAGLANEYLKLNPDSNIFYIDAINFTKEIYNSIQNGSSSIEELKDRYCQYEILIIDDVQYLREKTKTNEIFFNIFNFLINNNKIIIMTADKSPDQLHGFENRMISRFSSGITTKILNPDKNAVKTIIENKLSSNNIKVNEDGINLLIEWFNNDIRILIGALNKIEFYINNNLEDRILDKKQITNILEIETYSNSNTNKVNIINPMNIISNVAKLYNLNTNDILGSSRKKENIQARHLAMYILKKEYNLPLKEIGRIIGNRDHTTVMNGIDKIQKSIINNKDLLNTINSIIKKYK